MKDYASMSDFEINKRVFQAKTGLATLGYPHSADKRSCGHKDINGNYQWFDFCNNPADAWPIIVESKIGLSWGESDGEWTASGDYEMSSGCWDWDSTPKHYFEGDNPLRAAMIVFLMMKESEND